MRCRKARSYLSAYSKGELSGGRSTRVGRHLEHCSACRRESDIVRSVGEVMKNLPQLRASGDFNARLLQRIGRERFAETRTKAHLPGRIPRLGALRLATIGATAVVVLAAATGVNLTSPIFRPGALPVAVISPEGGSTADDLYLTIQPTNNPLLNERKSISRMVAQYNRWREYSRSLREHSAEEQFLGGDAAMTLASTRTAVDNYPAIDYRIRPVVRNYLIVPDNSSAGKRGTIF